jgi:hypothetical protein
MRGVCEASQPHLIPVDDDHFVSCFLYTEVGQTVPAKENNR